MRTGRTDARLGRRGRAARALILVLVGGYTLQLAGCAVGTVPVILSLAESTLLISLFGGFLP